MHLLQIFGLLALGLLGLGLFASYRWPLEMVLLQRRRALARVARRRVMQGPHGKLVYWVAGSGPTVALLHGAGDEAGTWARVVAELTTRDPLLGCRLLIPDLPGHGQSAPAGGPTHLGEVLAGLEALLEQEAPDEPVTLVGNSMGGWVALLYARRNPARVARLVLEDSGGIGEIAVSLQPTDRDEAAQLMRAVLGPESPIPKGFVLDNLVRRTRRGPIARLGAADSHLFVLEGRLDEIPAPAVVIWGEDDGVLPVEIGRRLAAGLPHGELWTIPRCGHIPHQECPDRFMPLLRQALEGGHAPR